MRALFYPIMAENKGFILTNNRLSHQSGIRKASVGKTLDLIPFLLFWSEKKKKKKKPQSHRPPQTTLSPPVPPPLTSTPLPFSLMAWVSLYIWFH
jgi:hypothetical protein